MTSTKIREFLDEMESTDLPAMERGRANKAAGLLTRVAHYLEIEERSGKRPAKAAEEPAS